MSPRRNKPARRAADASADEEPLMGGVQSVEVDRDGEEWIVRRITGSTSTKVYRCPGCDQEIRPATPHVVAWPSLAIDQRRHWHTPCWNARDRRSARGR
ncbi:MAG TPA: hypothetical protein VFN80_00250 [Acidothermaceae bacterium]|nr:hypothetical protein [Acidothermaceae bacterium]